MTAHERSGLRERIVSYMEYHPLRMPMSPQHARSFGYYTKQVFALFGVQIVSFRAIVGAGALLFFIAVPFVAEHALPGDTLYPIKVRFNEGVRSQLLFSPYEKMEWETQRVERRVAEARLLVKEGKLTEENENALEDTIRSHTTAFQAQLAALRQNDATDIAVAEVTLESALDVQSAVLNTEIAHEASATSPNEGNVSGLAAIVREARDDVALSTDNASSTASYEPLAARIEENTTRMHALSQSLDGELTEVQKADIQERTSAVGAGVTAAKKAYKAKKIQPAIMLLREALATTEKLIAFMSSIDLRANVSLDALVPQPTSDEMRKAELEETLASFVETHAAFVSAANTLEEPQKTDITKQLEILHSLLESAQDEIAFGHLDGAERIIREAETLVAHLEDPEKP